MLLLVIFDLPVFLIFHKDWDIISVLATQVGMSQALTLESIKPIQSSRRTARDLAILISLTLAIHLPFLGQAFHLDDTQYLDVAQNVYRNPFFPLDFSTAFEGLHY